MTTPEDPRPDGIVPPHIRDRLPAHDPHTDRGHLTPKAGGAAAAAAAATIITWIVETLTGIDLPPGIEGAIATIAGFLASLLIRDRPHPIARHKPHG